MLESASGQFSLASERVWLVATLKPPKVPAARHGFSLLAPGSLASGVWSAGVPQVSPWT